MLDLTTVGAIIGITKTGIEATRQATELVKNFRARSSSGTVSEAELKELTISLAEQLMQSRMDQLEVQNQLLELQSSLQKEDAFETTLALYRSTTLPAGGVIYRLRESDETGVYAENVCPTCVVKDRIFLGLQKLHLVYKCNSCNSSFYSEKAKTTPRRHIRGVF